MIHRSSHKNFFFKSVDNSLSDFTSFPQAAKDCLSNKHFCLPHACQIIFEICEILPAMTSLTFCPPLSWDCLLTSDAADTLLHLFMFAAQTALNCWHKFQMRSNVMRHHKRRVETRAIILILRQVICKMRWDKLQVSWWWHLNPTCAGHSDDNFPFQIWTRWESWSRH